MVLHVSMLFLQMFRRVTVVFAVALLMGVGLKGSAQTSLIIYNDSLSQWV